MANRPSGAKPSRASLNIRFGKDSEKSPDLWEAEAKTDGCGPMSNF
jgi:hypothetical protein